MVELSLRRKTMDQSIPLQQLAYATRIATELWERNFKTSAPNWKPAKDLMTLLSQIDNMTTRLSLVSLATDGVPLPPQTKKHTLWVIGYLGEKSCYLDVSKDEACRRYKLDNPDECIEFFNKNIRMVEFDDEFVAYDAWENP